MKQRDPIDPTDAVPVALEEAVPEVVSQAVCGILAKGWAVVDDFFEPAFVLEWGEKAREDFAQGNFRRAGVGVGHAVARPEIRSDHILWLDPEELDPFQAQYWQRMEVLRLELNRATFLGLATCEAHLALYPAGAFYGCHLDRFQNQSSRTISNVVYLNQDWRKDNGGALHLYLEEPECRPFEEVLPLGGRLACFLSAEFHHEVRPANRDRLSVTSWFSRNH
jgi:SM-20-related protein